MQQVIKGNIYKLKGVNITLFYSTPRRFNKYILVPHRHKAQGDAVFSTVSSKQGRSVFTPVKDWGLSLSAFSLSDS